MLWCTQDVLSILVEMHAMEQDTLRILPLGLVARGINCNNELWMAAAMTHPDVMSLTPPQLAAFVGALQCTDLLKRPMSIWSSFQVGRMGAGYDSRLSDAHARCLLCVPVSKHNATAGVVTVRYQLTASPGI